MQTTDFLQDEDVLLRDHCEATVLIDNPYDREEKPKINLVRQNDSIPDDKDDFLKEIANLSNRLLEKHRLLMDHVVVAWRKACSTSCMIQIVGIHRLALHLLGLTLCASADFVWVVSVFYHVSLL